MTASGKSHNTILRKLSQINIARAGGNQCSNNLMEIEMKWILLAATVVITGIAFTQKPSLADTHEYYPTSASGNCTYKTLEDCLR